MRTGYYYIKLVSESGGLIHSSTEPSPLQWYFPKEKPEPVSEKTIKVNMQKDEN